MVSGFIRLFFVFFCLVALGCAEPEPPNRLFLFLGHPYDWGAEDRVDARLEAFDYSPYEQIWLGGDVCARTAKDPAIMSYLDSLFDLERTHFALGNHDWDYGDRENVLNRLPDPPYYTVWQDGFCLTVLNTNLFWLYPSPPPQRDCADKQAQWAMLRAVADTISAATHWVILHHHALFNELKISPEGDTLKPFNLNPMRMYASCDSSTLVTQQGYPMLLQAQQRGVQPVLIGGDLGMRAKTFEYRTPEGIWMLGSGINNSVNREYAPEYVTDFGPDYLLELEYRDGGLDWRFFRLEGD